MRDDELSENRAGLLRLCTGHRIANMLFAGVELAIFDHIAPHGSSAQDVARACGIEPMAAAVLLHGLVAAELLDQEDTQFFVPPDLAPLLRSGPASVLPHIKLLHKESSYWARAAELLRPDYRGPLLADVQFRSDSVDAYMDLVEWNNHRYPALLWDVFSEQVPTWSEVLDVGPGFGYFSSELLVRNDRVVVTFYDIENALQRCRRRHEGKPYAARMRWQAGEAPPLPFRDRFDVVMANDLLHYFTSEDKLAFLRAAYAALKPGGRFAIVKFRLDDTASAPPTAAVFSFKMFLTTHKSHLESDTELEALAGQAGFGEVERIPLDELKTLVTGTRG